MFNKTVCSVAVFCGLLLVVVPLHGQSERSVGIVAGISQYDLSGTGTAPFAAARVDLVPARARFVVLEGSVELFTYVPQFAERQYHFFPEAMVQLQLPLASFRPYVGAGAGFSLSSSSALTLAAAGGFRIPIGSQWSARAELRVRGVDPWTGVTADWGAGVSRRF